MFLSGSHSGGTTQVVMEKCVRLIACFFSLVSALHADVTVGGGRPAVVQVPSGYDPAIPIPLIVLLHAYSFSSTDQENYWKLAPLAERLTFLCVRPNGTVDSSGYRFWNSTDTCCDVYHKNVDDSGYMRGLIDEIGGLFNVDRDRICVAGLSNGGFMSYRMACDHAQTISAIASQAGAMYLDPSLCAPASPVNVLQVHGTTDSVVLYEGGHLHTINSLLNGVVPGAVQTVTQWATYNGCSLPSVATDETLDLVSDVSGDETFKSRFQNGCPSGGTVELWTMQGTGHIPNLVQRGATTALGESVVAWLFSHPKRAAPMAGFNVTPPQGTAPFSAAFDASPSTAPEGTALASFYWDFGDGTKDSGRTVTHAYNSPGRYVTSLRVVTDDQRVSLVTSAAVTASCPTGNIAPWIPADIGAPAFPGSARFEPGPPGPSDLVVCGGGKPIGSTGGDQHFFVCEEVSGSLSVTARFSRPTSGAFLSSRVGVMVRESLDPGAPFAAMLLELGAASPRFRFFYRTDAAGGASSRSGAALTEPYGWVRLERRGSVFTGFSSLDGSAWTMVGEQTIAAIPADALAGFAASRLDSDPRKPFTPVEVRVSSLEVVPTVTEPSFHRGDPNSSGTSDISDAVSIFGYLFLGSESLTCLESADVNNSGEIDISDGITVLNWLFAGGQEPATPGPPPAVCGVDPDPAGSDGDLGCTAYTACN